MSTYNGRRAPNVSRYLQDLNAISPENTTANEENFNVDDQLSFFTNTEFFDLDSGQNTDFQAPPTKPDVVATPAPSSTEDPTSVMGDISNMDFMNGEFNFQEFGAYPQGPSMNNAFADGHNFQPLQPNHGPVYNGQVHPQQAQFHQPAAAARGADKRKASEAAVVPSRPPPANLEEASRVAAEEDKRRRNTAASARFRVKKKQREQALEKSAKEMNDKMSGLESRVSQLETENKWLKNLLVDKNEGNDDIAVLWKEFTKQAGKRGKSDAVKDSR